MEEDKLNGFKIKNKVDCNLKCNICLEVLNIPVALKECGHVFCKDCINEWRSNCPNCRIKYSGYINMYNLENITNNIIVYCKNEGCKKIMKYEYMKKHINNCYYGTMDCEYCNHKGIKKEHKMDKCLNIIEKMLINEKNKYKYLQEDINKILLKHKKETNILNKCNNSLIKEINNLKNEKYKLELNSKDLNKVIQDIHKDKNNLSMEKSKKNRENNELTDYINKSKHNQKIINIYFTIYLVISIIIPILYNYLKFKLKEDLNIILYIPLFSLILYFGILYFYHYKYTRKRYNRNTSYLSI